MLTWPARKYMEKGRKDRRIKGREGKTKANRAGMKEMGSKGENGVNECMDMNVNTR